MREIGMYIHIPFCKQKCLYCDFVSFSNKESKQDSYINCLIKELEYKVSSDYLINTIYIGGGTPSYLEQGSISKILSAIRNNYKIKEDAEITIEINPGTVDAKKLEEYKEARINRVSIGLQETDNNLLKEIGRIHTYEEFLDTYKLIEKIGFTNKNIDLMIGLPNQTISNIKESLEKVINLNPEHISMYSLILEEGTPIYNKVKKGELELPNEEEERMEYWYLKNKLELAGYKHYEISNFSKQGKESKHNTNCWNQNEYLGFGVAAHSYIEGIRYSNIDSIEKYIENIEKNNIEQNKLIQEEQNEEDKEKEFMLLGLRKIDGVSIQDFKAKYGKNPIYVFKESLQKLVEEGLLEIDLDKIKLTNKGLDLANLVWEEFV